MEDKKPVRIKLGNNFDQLLFDKNYSQDEGGLFLPLDGDPGTGNIVIKGSPGTGKSTLALQMLYQTTRARSENSIELFSSDYFALYFSLEEQIDHVINKMQKYQWINGYSGIDKNYISLRKLVHLQNTDDSTSPEKLADYLVKILSQPDGCRIRNSNAIGDNTPDPSACGHIRPDLHPDTVYGSYVLLPMLSPRGVKTDNNGSSIYWERYKQIEKYLIAAHYIKNRKKEENSGLERVPELKIVCIDSLNVFGDGHLDRDEIFRLFDLFKRYGIIGVFIFESNQERSDPITNQMGNDIEFTADVVISLQNEQDGYMMRYLEVEKSRYKPQVYGKHPFYIVNRPSMESNQPFLPLWVYPSLHYKLNEYSCQKSKSSENNEWFLNDSFKEWKQKFGNIIPDSFKRSFTIMLSGPRNTYKSAIAKEFLIQGHQYGYKNKDNYIDSMIICLGGKHYDCPENWKQYKNPDVNGNRPAQKELQLKYKKEESAELLETYAAQKIDIEKWQLEDAPEHFILSVVIKKKAIPAEEFIHHLQYNILGKYPTIRRVILDEVNMIGLSYPFLRSSKTSNELFLNALVALLKEMGIDLIMTGTSGEMAQSDEVISRAVSLSDITLTTRFCDVFGKQNVIITGGGMITNESNNKADNFTPGVLRVDNSKRTFFIDHEHLNGLVGFEIGKVYRPGLAINLFEEGRLQKEYNKQISIMYNLYFPENTNMPAQSDRDSSVNITTFNDRDVEAIQKTVKRIRSNYPHEGTVVSMVDEYWDNDLIKSNGGLTSNIQKKLYYANCLVLAYRTDVIKHDLKKGDITWREIYDFAKPASDLDQILCLMDADFFITETLSCLLLDTMVDNYCRKNSINSRSPEVGAAAKKDLVNKALEDFYCDLSDDSIIEQLFYLKLLLKINPLLLNDKHSSVKSDNKYPNMCKDSLMYVCWYTQLREFLSYHPEYISKIGVTALPGGGFSGDWMLEVMPGSLNNELGANTLKLLCNPNEEIKRFMQGVGLPAWLNEDAYVKYNMDGFQYQNKKKKPDISVFADTLPAWIGAKDITLKNISDIYNLANRRTNIENYEELRHMLSITFRWLMALKLPDGCSEKEQMDKFMKDAKINLDQLKTYIRDIKKKNQSVLIL